MTPLNEFDYRVEVTYNKTRLIDFITAKSFTEAVDKANSILGYHTRTENKPYRLTRVGEVQDGSR